jgi:hypothetical protein
MRAFAARADLPMRVETNAPPNAAEVFKNRRRFNGDMPRLLVR